MATAAIPRNEIENTMRMGLMIHRSQDVLQDVLSTQLLTTYPGLFDPSNGGKLFDILTDQKANQTLLQLKKMKVLNASQMKLLYPSGNPSTTVTLKDLDVTLTVVLLRNITTLNPKGSWENPPTSDTSMEAQIGRVKKYRNKFSHGGASLTDAAFQTQFTELKALLLSLSTIYSSDDYDKLLTDPLHAAEAPCELISTNLPSRTPELKGRVDLVQKILQHVENDTKLILLTGMGGIGKTSIAVEVGHHRKYVRKDVLHIDMRKVVNLDSVKLSLVQQYHPNQFLKDIYSDYQNKFTQTMSNLATDTLLILDNNDSVLNSHQQEFLQLLEEVMNSSKHITLLCTSRESFSLPSQTTVTIDIPPLGKTSSSEVLWGENTISPTDTETEALGEISEKCGHNPLALKLAATQIKLKTVQKVFEKMKRIKVLPSLQLPNIPASQGMLTCLEMSYETLNDTEKKVFRGLHIFPVAFHSKEVSEILEMDEDECESVLDNLSAKSLLSLVQNTYDLHPLVKEYAEFLAQTDSNEISHTRKKYCDYYIRLMLQLYIVDTVEASLFENMSKLVPHLHMTATLLKMELCTSNIQQKKIKINILQEIANTFHFLFLNEEALSIFQSVEVEMHTKFEGQPTEKAELQNNIGCVLHAMDKGKYKEAHDYYKKCLEIREELLGINHSDTATSYNNIGRVQQSMGKYKEALDYHKKCLEVREALLGPKHPETATTYGHIGCALKAMGKYEEALDYQKKCLKVREELLGPKHPDTASSYNSIGDALQTMDMGEYKEALDYHKTCLKVREELLGSKHPDTATSYDNIACTLKTMAMGKYKESLDNFKICLEVREELQGTKHPDTAVSYNNIGNVLSDMDMGKFKEALDYYKKSEEVMEEVLGPKHPNTAQLYGNIGYLLQIMGDYKGALPYLKRCHKLRKEILGPKHPNTDMS
ncbi:nephrocystin-3-like [Lingula anatina]|uniref:Nephrocystin-3-like n=1 Tax=Lingula anatina TaxID=7574 RepID=A0A1S3H5J2_LINAN|nr:nephrocystin-3-like [Lingula anatina]|eukprot:XP_013381237.1 nephrocystin-3-like [Lingula anatina]